MLQWSQSFWTSLSDQHLFGLAAHNWNDRWTPKRILLESICSKFTRTSSKSPKWNQTTPAARLVCRKASKNCTRRLQKYVQMKGKKDHHRHSVRDPDDFRLLGQERVAEIEVAWLTLTRVQTTASWKNASTLTSVIMCRIQSRPSRSTTHIMHNATKWLLRSFVDLTLRCK